MAITIYMVRTLSMLYHFPLLCPNSFQDYLKRVCTTTYDFHQSYGTNPCFLSIFADYVRVVNYWTGFWQSKIRYILHFFFCSWYIFFYLFVSSFFSFHSRTASRAIRPLLTGTFHFVRKNSRYSEKDAAVVVRQMLKVAAECHLHGLVHRDMKPEVEIERFQCLGN